MKGPNSPPNAALHDSGRLESMFSDKAVHARVIAIVSAGFLERHIEQLLVQRMPGLDSKLSERMFGIDGVLSPLASKLHMAQALALIEPVDRANMLRVAKIRNLFAHDLDISTFEHHQVRKLIQGFSFEGLSVRLPIGGLGPLSELADHRDQFCAAMRFISWRVIGHLRIATGMLDTSRAQLTGDEPAL